MGKHIPQKQDNNYHGQKGQPGGDGIGLKKRKIRKDTLFINKQEDEEELVEKYSDKTPLFLLNIIFIGVNKALCVFTTMCQVHSQGVYPFFYVTNFVFFIT